MRTDYTAETVAVMFTDVIGFSDIAAQVSPDEIADLIKAVLSAQTAAIQAEEGEVDKFIGDAIMAYWIVSGSRKVDLENAAGRALRAARQALHAAANIQSPLDGAPLGLRIGLNLGAAYSGDFGSATRSAFTLIGHDINVGARLEQAREGNDGDPLGPIRISESFYAHLGAADCQLFPKRTTVTVKHTVVTLYSNPGFTIT